MKRTNLIATITLVLALAGATTAAESASVRDNLRAFHELDRTCRAGYTNAKRVDYACSARHKYYRALNRQGLCYGKHTQVGADHEWHECTSDSIR